MSHEFLFPDVGEGINEGKLVEWKVTVGDTIQEDDVLCDVETDKAVVEIPSPQAGTIQELHGKTGEVIKVGNVLVTFAEASQETQKEQAPTQEESKEEVHAPKQEKQLVKEEKPVSEEQLSSSQPSQQQISKTDKTSTSSRVLAAPSTRRLARELGVDITTITGSGPSGRVLTGDVQSASGGGQQPSQNQPVKEELIQKKQSAPAQEESKQEAKQPVQEPSQETSSEVSYSGRRKAIGEHVLQAAAAPTFTEFATADATAIIELRNHLKEKAEGMGVKLTYLSFFAKALCAALRKYPVLNSHFKDDSIQQFSQVSLGIAADTEKGLVVPVVQDADKKSVLEIASDISSLATKAKDNSLSREEMSGSTFSISSIGPLRVEGFTPMLNTPEVAILGIGGFQKRPWVVGEDVVAREVVTFSLTVDHRVVDGALAAKFLTYFVELVEDPELLVLGGI
ncbi:MAG: dihydrolipoamide acetyltransferase family protein [Candidatus Woesearchaeota archaeon]